MNHASLFSGIGAPELAAFGNSMVPQVIYQIFQAIDIYEILN
jgi:hypothetical protein